jgi:hypothetical protein
MSRVLSAPRSAALWPFGAFVILGIITLPAHANDLEASPAQPWCLARSGELPDCTYDDLLVCSVKAFTTGGYCTKVEPPVVQPVATAEPVPPPKQRKPARRKLATAPNDELFREFVRWKQAGGK